MRKVLGKNFFNRPVLTVAPELLGKFLVRRYRGREIASMIVETEAYDGVTDLACHARNGQTKRNTPMFDEPATIYVYFTYGMHWMLNLVAREKGYPAAVLVRGVVVETGPARTPNLASQSVKKLDSGLSQHSDKDLYTARYGGFAEGTMPKLVSGPARLTKKLKIDKALNHKTLGKRSGLWVEDRGVKISKKDIMRTPRIGVSYAGEWAEKPYRFVLKKEQNSNTLT